MKRNKMRFKFIIPIILAVIVIAGIIAIGLKSSNIYAAYTDTSNGNNITYTLSKTTLRITGSGKVTDAWKNSSLNSELSNVQTSITAVSIGKNITGIEASAFEGCTALKTVTFSTGATCTSIGNKAFKGCTALTNIINVTTKDALPKTITTIGNEAFSGCTSLAKLNLNTGVTNVGENAFQGATSLADLKIYNIQNATNAFKGNKALTTLTIGNTCTAIQNNMFEGCTELTTVTFAKSSTCTTIGNSAFKGCTKLNNIKNNTTANTLPASITKIGNEAFSGCTSLTTVTFASDSTCTSIGNSAFDGCTSLTDFTIPDQVTTIDSSTFRGCSVLNSLTVGTGVTSIGKDAFKDAKLEGTLNYNAINCTTYNNAFTGKQIGKVKIGKNVTVIPENFIKGNKVIKHIILPESVTNIKADAFNDAPINDGIWIRNRNCKVETTSTISNYTSVFVELPAKAEYRSFTGVDSNGTTFSTLLKWLNENNKRYIPFATTLASGNKVSDTQSTIGADESLKEHTSQINDYRFENTSNSRKWIFALLTGNGGGSNAMNNNSFGLTAETEYFWYFPVTFSHRANCGMKTGIGTSTNSFYAYAGGTYDFFCMVGGCDHQKWSGEVQVLNASRNCN
ncbi:MAG: leucine-rich repeat domain-containing protein [Clostridia bacterium]|nr:leucine-rich repeat domain-containing protein [Clostridia bacterium]